jgi:hypothetical protein
MRTRMRVIQGQLAESQLHRTSGGATSTGLAAEQAGNVGAARQKARAIL